MYTEESVMIYTKGSLMIFTERSVLIYTKRYDIHWNIFEEKKNPEKYSGASQTFERF